MVHLAVQQLHAEVHFKAFGCREDAAEAGGAVFQALFVVEAGAVPGKTDEQTVAGLGLALGAYWAMRLLFSYGLGLGGLLAFPAFIALPAFATG
jgi:hypothetical protein